MNKDYGEWEDEDVEVDEGISTEKKVMGFILFIVICICFGLLNSNPISKKPTPLDNLVDECGETMGWIIVSDNAFQDPELPAKAKNFFNGFYAKNMPDTMKGSMIDSIQEINSTNTTRSEKKDGCYRFYKHSSFVTEYEQWLENVVPPDEMDKHKDWGKFNEDGKYEKFLGYITCNPKSYRIHQYGKITGNSLCKSAGIFDMEFKETLVYYDITFQSDVDYSWGLAMNFNGFPWKVSRVDAGKQAEKLGVRKFMGCMVLKWNGKGISEENKAEIRKQLHNGDPGTITFGCEKEEAK